MTKTAIGFPNGDSAEERTMQGFMELPELPTQVPDALVRKSINSADLDDRFRANNSLWHWGLRLLQELVKAFERLHLETRKNTENTELMAQELQKMRELLFKE